MKKSHVKDNFLTIPNILSVIRIVLIYPFVINVIKNNYFAYLENRLDDMKNNDNNEEMISKASH